MEMTERKVLKVLPVLKVHKARKVQVEIQVSKGQVAGTRITTT